MTDETTPIHKLRAEERRRIVDWLRNGDVYTSRSDAEDLADQIENGEHLLPPREPEPERHGPRRNVDAFTLQQMSDLISAFTPSPEDFMLPSGLLLTRMK